METSETLGLHHIGLSVGKIYRNLSFEEIHKHESENKEVIETSLSGCVTVDTGKFTGRSPDDKFFVKQSPSQDNIWWGKVNRPMTPEAFDELYSNVCNFMNGKTVYVFDGFCGAVAKTRKRVRFVTQSAWQHHFVTNMFIRPTEEELNHFVPDFTTINACNYTEGDWKRLGLKSENFVCFNIEKNTCIIGGTSYAGEMKKGILSMMTWWLPESDHLPMHCSANKDKLSDSTAIFFGLSGTGKTTLSADPARMLIGDDEHGWDDDGIYNFEGGCYAKTINLSAEHEPDIYNAIKRDALLENIWLEGNVPDFYNISKTENGRVSYPIYHIPNYHPAQHAGQPTAVIYLACDAYGVLPPVARLSSEQAMYHFLSGYTAKVAGTERGVKTPTATFSACFGDVFMVRHPSVYAEILGRKLKKYNTPVYLVNTGWSGGGYGVGKRMPIRDTRGCITAILEGQMDACTYVKDPVFGFEIPVAVPGVDTKLLNPRNTWPDASKYDETADLLANQFIANYAQYRSPGVPDFTPFGPIKGAAL